MRWGKATERRVLREGWRGTRCQYDKDIGEKAMSHMERGKWGSKGHGSLRDLIRDTGHIQGVNESSNSIQGVNESSNSRKYSATEPFRS